MSNNKDGKVISIVEQLNQKIAAIKEAPEPVIFGESTFIQMLIEKLEERNVHPAAIEHLKENDHSIRSDYDFEDHKHIEIINNKVNHAYEMFENVDYNDLKIPESSTRKLHQLFFHK